MKKLLSLVLAGTMAFALAAPTFAADVSVNGNQSADVHATYVAANAELGAAVYSANITWGTETGDLKYDAGSTTYTWSANDLKYNGTTTSGWSGSKSIQVTVENRSDAKISYTAVGSNQYNLTKSGDVSDAVEISYLTANVSLEEVGNYNSDGAITSGVTTGTTITYTGADTAAAPAEADATNRQVTVGTITVTLKVGDR